MLCSKCKDKPIARGIKQFDCHICGETSFQNYAYHGVCKSCSTQRNLCECCMDSLDVSESDLNDRISDDASKRIKILMDSNMLLAEQLDDAKKLNDELTKTVQQLQDRIDKLAIDNTLIKAECPFINKVARGDL